MGKKRERDDCECPPQKETGRGQFKGLLAREGLTRKGGGVYPHSQHLRETICRRGGKNASKKDQKGQGSLCSFK